MTTANPDQRVVDDTYVAVFPLSKAQLGTHCADVDNETASEKYGMDNIRITQTDKGVVVESTKGTMVVKVTEKNSDLATSPFSVNPSEAAHVILTKPVYLKGSVANKIFKALPQRKNTSSEQWQKEVVFSVNEDGTMEAGYSDKQGNALLENVEVVPEDSKLFPPIESVWPPIDPTLRVGFKVERLRDMIDVLENAEIETVALEFFERSVGNVHYDQGRAIKFIAIEPRPGKSLPREVEGLLMPFNIE